MCSTNSKSLTSSLLKQRRLRQPYAANCKSVQQPISASNQPGNQWVIHVQDAFVWFLDIVLENSPLRGEDVFAFSVRCHHFCTPSRPEHQFASSALRSMRLRQSAAEQQSSTFFFDGRDGFTLKYIQEQRDGLPLKRGRDWTFPASAKIEDIE